VNILLDTHVLIWSLANSPDLGAKAKELIITGDNLIFVSAASIWEIAIKKSIGKLKAPDNLLEELTLHRFTLLDINAEHALAVEKLPDIHKDPFDRMLIAQAGVESLQLITADSQVRKYPVSVIAAEL